MHHPVENFYVEIYLFVCIFWGHAASAASHAGEVNLRYSFTHDATRLAVACVLC